MAHRYRDPIVVRRAPSAGLEQAPGLAGFLWRGVWYEIDATLATWRLRDRWWVTPADTLSGTDDAADAQAPAPAERVYYRVRCVDPEGEQIFDLYEDIARRQWILDRAHG